MSITPHALSNYYKQALFDTIAKKFEKYLEPGNVYADSVGVPTIGYGYALIVKNNNTGLWEIRGGNNGQQLTADLASVGITLQKSDTDLLSKIVTDLNAGNTTSAKTRIGDGSGFSFSLTEPEAQSLFINTISRYEDIVKTKIGTTAYNQLVGSEEMVALVSLAYNSESLIGPKLTSALQNGNRAEAWFEIRYNSNNGDQDANTKQALAKRRYYEAELFGLYNDSNDVSTDEAKSVFRMYTRHKTEIDTYEQTYSAQIAKANSDYGTTIVQTLNADLGMAKTILLANYAPNAIIDGQVIVGAGLDSYAYLESSHDDRILGTDKNDLIFGEKGNDTIIGNGGSDVIYGGDGNDLIAGGAGNKLYTSGGSID